MSIFVYANDRLRTAGKRWKFGACYRKALSVQYRIRLEDGPGSTRLITTSHRP